MKNLTEQQILAMAPNAAAAANGRKIAKAGFVRLEKSSDDTLFLGECTGSGKNNYITTVDFIDETAPVCRCSCPSRQFPCKHGLALLFVILEGREFGNCEIPEDIARKRAKLAGKQGSGGDKPELTKEQAEKKKAAAERLAKNARSKKLKIQLEGLAHVEQLVVELLRNGLGTMGAASIKTYEELSKQLGDYYLPGPQRLLNRLIIEVSEYQKDGRDSHYEEAIDVLERLRYLVKKAKEYLTHKIESGEVAVDDNMLYEELGGIWKLGELRELGRGMGDSSLLQLSFWVNQNEAARQYEDISCYVSLEDGKLYLTKNYRPYKALKYIKADDTIFGVVCTQSAASYPGVGTLRIRWEGAGIRDVAPEDLARVVEKAEKSISTAVKNAKNILMNPLADAFYLGLVAYDSIGKVDEQLVLRDYDGGTIMLGNAPGMEPCADRMKLLPDSSLFKNQVLLGAFYYERAEKRIKMMPLSIVTLENIIRLLY